MSIERAHADGPRPEIRWSVVLPGSRVVSHRLLPPQLTLVVPAYNEAARLETTAIRLRAAVGAGPLDAARTELIVVDDGSSDDTADVARQLFGEVFPHFGLIPLPANRGKGAAVRAGVAAARAPVVAFMDADMAVGPEQLPELVAGVTTADVAIGSRAVPGAVVRRATLRRTVMGRTFNRLVRSVTRVESRDTQCGFKAFRTPMARLLFHFMAVDGFAFDADLLHLAGLLGLRIAEVPVCWSDGEGSRVRALADSTAMTVDVLRLRRRATRTPVAGLEIALRDRSGGVAWHLDDLVERHIPVLLPSPVQALALFPLFGGDEVAEIEAELRARRPDLCISPCTVSLDHLRVLAPMRVLGPTAPEPRAGVDRMGGTALCQPVRGADARAS